METLRTVTETTVVTETTTVTEERYKVQAPETMQETFMSESEDEGGNVGSIEKWTFLINFKNVLSSNEWLFLFLLCFAMIIILSVLILLSF